MMPHRLRRAASTSTVLALVVAMATGCSASVSPAMAPPMDAGPAPVAPGEKLAEAMPMPSPAGIAQSGMEPYGGAPQDESAARSAPSAPSSAKSSAPSPTGGPASPATGKSAAVSEAAPLIVYQGELTMRVDAGKGPAGVDAIVTLAESLGGHLAGRDEGRVIVKIPSGRFREAMSRLEGAFEVERRNVKAEDVTAEFKDLEVRLENLRATRKRIEELMQKSGTLADTLSVERELERVAAEIDRIQGRLRFLRTHTSFSTLTATVVERSKAPVVIAQKPAPVAKRDLALSLGWLDRVGVDSLVAVPPED